MKKRFLSVFLAASLFITSFVAFNVISTFASSTEPTLFVSSATGAQGDEVTVTVTMSNNPGLICLTYRLEYDSKYLTLKSRTNEGLIKDSNGDSAAYQPSQNLTVNPYYQNWEISGSESDFAGDGILATYTFTIKSDAPNVETEIKLITNNKNDNYGIDPTDILKTVPVTFDVVDGIIKVYTELTPPAATDVTIDYTGEKLKVKTGLEFALGYAVASDAADWEELTTAGVDISSKIGSSVYICKLDSNGNKTSDAVAVTIPVRPETSVLSINYTAETITIPATYEYNIGTSAVYSSTGTGSAVSISSEIGSSNSIYYRTKASASAFSGTGKVLAIPARPTTPSAPTSKEIKADSIELNAIAGAEYSKGGATWQDNPIFTGLTKNTEYTFYARIKATTSSFVSEISAGANITAGKVQLAGTVSIGDKAVYGQELTASVSGTPSDAGTLLYQWKRDNVDITGETSNKYTIIKEDIGKVISVEVKATSEDYSGSITSNALTAEKAELASVTFPTATGITYGETYADAIDLSTGTGDGLFTFDPATPATGKPGVETQTAAVVFTPTDSDCYKTETKNISITVEKANPVITEVYTTDIKYGQKLSDSITTAQSIKNPKDDSTVAGVFSWKASATQPSASGVQTYVFTPTDTVNYNTVEDTVSVTVLPADQNVAFNVSPSSQKVEKTSTVTVTLTNPYDAALKDNLPALNNVTVKVDETEMTLTGSGGVYSGTFTVPADAEIDTVYNFIAKITTNTAYYNITADKSATLTVTDKDVCSISLTPDKTSLTYGENVKFTVTLTGNGIDAVTGTVDFKNANGDILATRAIGTDVIEYALDKANVGTHTIIAVYSGDENYAPAENSKEISVDKKQITITPKDVILTTGDKIPDVYEYEATGFVGSDTFNIEPTVTCNITSTDDKGTYDIIASGADAGNNYVINYTSGILSVNYPALTGDIIIDGTSRYGETLTASLESSNNTGELSYIWKIGDEVGSTIKEYVLTASDIGKKITVFVSSDKQTGILDKETETIGKALFTSDVVAPELSDSTSNSITLKVVDGYEYSINGGTSWQSSNSFAGLSSSTEYKLVQRVVETATVEASEASAELTVKTKESSSDNNNVYNPSYIIPADSGTTVQTPTVIKPLDNEMLKEALANDNPVISLTKETGTVLSSDMLQEILNAGKTVTFELENGFSIMIDPATITDTSKAVNLYVDVIIASKATQINDNYKTPANSIVIIPSMQGDFGFEMNITISAKALNDSGVKAKNAKLYYISDDGDVTDLGKVKVNTDGSAEIKISHASQYVLSENPPVLNEENEIIAKDENDFDDTQNVGIINDNSIDNGNKTYNNTENPKTGVVVALGSAIISLGALVISKKKKNK